MSFAHSSEFLGASGGFSLKLQLKPIARPVAAHAPKSPGPSLSRSSYLLGPAEREAMAPMGYVVLVFQTVK